MKKVLRVLGAILALLLVVVGGFALWARSAAASKLEATYDTHTVDFPVPFPLTEEEKKALGEGEDPAKVAQRRALERGKHLVESRYACIECHGQDFGGGTMMDAMPVARLFGPNLTTGEGSVVKGYTIADWDRAVRHGVLHDGRASAMPSEDYIAMSDQELSDIIAYIRAQPPVNKPSPPRELGPVGTMLTATGKLQFSADKVDHQAAHAATPPPTEATAAFGKHLINICTGCHRQGLEGGPIVAGDPNWPPAKNITPHEQGLKGWTYENFVAAMREARSKDGTAIKMPMSMLKPYAERMTDVEMKAMWLYLQTVEPKPTGT